jgi:hypothetical protein
MTDNRWQITDDQIGRTRTDMDWWRHRGHRGRRGRRGEWPMTGRMDCVAVGVGVGDRTAARWVRSEDASWGTAGHPGRWGMSGGFVTLQAHRDGNG